MISGPFAIRQKLRTIPNLSYYGVYVLWDQFFARLWKLPVSKLSGQDDCVWKGPVINH